MDLSYERTGNGEPLVLIHGIGHRLQAWRPVVELICDQRETLALDLPGFGQSPMPPPGTPPGVSSLTRLVAEFLDEQALERPHVAGNSLGGFVGLELAKQGRVRSVTAISPAGFQSRPESYWSHSTLWLTRRVAGLVDGRIDRLVRAPAVPHGFSQLIAHPERIPAAELAGDVHALAHSPWFDATLPVITHERFSGGEEITVPVTIAWGERDHLLLPRQALRAARLIPHARVVKLRACGHLPYYDDPQQVAQVLLEGSGG